MQLGIYSPAGAVFRRLRDSSLEEIQIELLSPVRKTARATICDFEFQIALPSIRSRPSLIEMTSPSAGSSKIFSTSLEKTQSCPCKIRGRRRTTIPAITTIVGQPCRLPNAVAAAVSGAKLNPRFCPLGTAAATTASGSACPTNVTATIVSAMQALRDIKLPEIKKLRSGKVREVFDLGDNLLFVVSDRLSAFDVILPDPIPYKGAVLNQISAFWFQKLDFAKNHFITADFDEFPQSLRGFRDQLAGRSMLVKKTEPLSIECVVRGYLAGSGWKDYQQTGSVCGVKLPDGLQLASKLPGPIFTPSTKSDVGHDLNIDLAEAGRMVGAELTELARDLSLELYQAGSEYAAARGIIIADTKFEFGRLGDELLLIDECLTPDSSRFWPADEYHVGSSPPSFDKQFVRDYLETLDWDKTPPAPHLPREIIEKTSAKYREAFSRLTGGKLE